MDTITLDASTRTAAGGAPMNWPEAFAITGVAMAIAFLVYVICRWG
ncbi:hypothetical protein AB85_1270 [Escherichia coli 2-156-04_S3_C1]|nr:hypothetical protein AB85_1270 [Escherichia coli 2-156-04_S3_C1]